MANRTVRRPCQYSTLRTAPITVPPVRRSSPPSGSAAISSARCSPGTGGGHWAPSSADGSFGCVCRKPEIRATSRSDNLFPGGWAQVICNRGMDRTPYASKMLPISFPAAASAAPVPGRRCIPCAPVARCGDSCASRRRSREQRRSSGDRARSAPLLPYRQAPSAAAQNSEIAGSLHARSGRQYRSRHAFARWPRKCRKTFGSTVAAASIPPRSAPGMPGLNTS